MRRTKKNTRDVIHHQVQRNGVIQKFMEWIIQCARYRDVHNLTVVMSMTEGSEARYIPNLICLMYLLETICIIDEITYTDF